MNGHKKVQMWEKLQSFSLSQENVLRSIVYIFQGIFEQREKAKQSGRVQKAEIQTSQSFRATIQHTSSLDTKKFWSTKNLSKMQEAQSYWPVYKLG